MKKNKQIAQLQFDLLQERKYKKQWYEQALKEMDTAWSIEKKYYSAKKHLLISIIINMLLLLTLVTYYVLSI